MRLDEPAGWNGSELVSSRLANELQDLEILLVMTVLFSKFHFVFWMNADGKPAKYHKI